MALGAAEEVVSIETTEGKFLVVNMTGHEHLGRMYEYTVEVAGATNLLGEPAEVDLHDLLGTRATVKLEVDEDPRYFDGFVTRARRGEKRGRYVMFTLTLEPWLWFTTRTKNSRVFQKKSVKEIVTELLADYSGDNEWRLDSPSDYPKLDYCIQYAETDFAFVSRLLEEVGIYYFFEHEDGGHKCIFTDGQHESREDSSAIKWSNSMKAEATVTNWYTQEEARSISTVLTEYDYLAPKLLVEGKKTAAKKPEKLGSMEWFEHPAYVVQNGVKPDKTDAGTAATQRAGVRMDELTSLSCSSTGTTNARDFGVGVTFEIEDSPNDDDNTEYLMVSAIYRLDFSGHEAIDDLKTSDRHEGFRCDFLALRTDAPTFRSPRSTPRPVIAGPQTAVVVGASGNEIETDKHGRIKVQFHWDRKGEKNENSSCWVRVAQPWAGKGFGVFVLPRVGQEVVVQFLDGDPDRPLVTGSVYNNENMPAWTLPTEATVAGIKSRSSKEGTPKTANELRIEDKKDSEYIWIQAQKNFHRLVKHDAFDWIGNNESVKVKLTRNEVIGENWFMDITKDVMHNMGKDLHVNVAGDIFYTGGATYQLKLVKDMNAKIDGDLGFEVGGKTHLKTTGDIVLQSTTGKLSLKAGDAGDVLVEGLTIKIKAGTTVAIEGTAGVSLKCGGSFVSVGPAGVDIVGPLVKINSGGAGGSASAALAASPAAPTEAKKEELLTAAKESDYNKTFDDPMPTDSGGSGPAGAS